MMIRARINGDLPECVGLANMDKIFIMGYIVDDNGSANAVVVRECDGMHRVILTSYVKVVAEELQWRK